MIMRWLILSIFFCQALVFPVFPGAEDNPEFTQKYKDWLEKDVFYIITPKEKSAFLQLENDRQRDLFIREFWRQRDPSPGTPRSEFREEHYRRLAVAERLFSRGTSKPGWKTDRGRIYIILGPPINRQRFDNPDIYPIELWYYQGAKLQRIEPFFYVMFYKKFGVGDFILYDPLTDGPNILSPETSEIPWDPGRPKFDAEASFFGGSTKDQAFGGTVYGILYKISPDLAQASLTLLPYGSSADPTKSNQILGHVNQYPSHRVNDKYVSEFLERRASVEVDYSVNYIENLNVVKIFKDSNGVDFVHYAIQPEILSLDTYADKFYSQINLLGRISDLEGNTVFQYTKSYPMEFTRDEIPEVNSRPMTIQDSFPLIPGHFRFNCLLENAVSKEFTSFEKEIVIPKPSGALRMSALLLAYDVQEIEDASRTAFQIRDMRLIPSLDNRFSPKEILSLYFRFYEFGQELSGGATLIWGIYRGEKKIHEETRKSRTYPQKSEFLARFPLEDYEPGIYTAKVVLKDKNGYEVLSTQEDFCVMESPLSRAWINAKKIDSEDDAVYSYLLGTQLLNVGEVERARIELDKAYQRDRDSLDFALGYSEVLFVSKEFAMIKYILKPFLSREVENDRLYASLGRASQGLKEYDEALVFYQTFMEHEGLNYEILNAEGQCHRALGYIAEAVRVWEKSLELNPDQPDIKKILENLKLQ
ncbi:MAG TPA: GWxTD domain-containing protein [Candidatus Heimdallarchaeota archaeon]|nr:GWxTD domain-containing protein [Candidatus Heimdallarchaeota archaeon]